jgi:hypothetical protein
LFFLNELVFFFQQRTIYGINFILSPEVIKVNFLIHWLISVYFVHNHRGRNQIMNRIEVNMFHMAKIIKGTQLEIVMTYLPFSTLTPLQKGLIYGSRFLIAILVFFECYILTVSHALFVFILFHFEIFPSCDFNFNLVQSHDFFSHLVLYLDFSRSLTNV